ncbi:hypothetical protein C2S53_001215 [Perilla frutescens var. hirtella]|uniref:Cytochrome P450 n=1 Tax=Perilla frutescens var. hirtella TaxID=608512 RepID=A0AAD4JQD3_PERFH|nr:hypothetical protein C2S53_001215 [Perilla frutescens var. hirtella]
MEFEFEFSAFFLLLTSFFFFFIFKLGINQSKIIKPKLNLPPGPRKLPFIGSLHLLAGSNPPQYTLRDLAKKYGPLMYIKLGEVGNVVVSSPETAKQFLKTHDVVFASRPSLLASEISCYNNTDVAFAPYGEYWRQLRKICTLELLSVKRVKSFKNIREEEVLGLCKWIAENEGSSFNLMEKISMTNYDIMARAALGKKSGEQAKFVAVVKGAVEFFSVFRVVDVYPSFRFFHRFSPQRRKIQNLHDQSDTIIGKIMEERRAEYATESDDRLEKDEDFLDVLFRLQSDGSLQIPLTTDNVKAILAEMFGAGTVTSSNIVEWAMAEMLNNPRVLKRAQDEVREVFDSKKNVNESYFDELKYLKLVIKETLRRHPPAPLLLPRESRERCEINGFEIPAGTRVLVNVWAMGRDPEYWEDPESFKPERFVEKAVDFKGNSYEYIPFGAGRKMCPGITFGLANVEMPLAMFLYYFDWILPHGIKPEDLDMTEFNGVENRKKHNLCAIPLLRRPLP